MAPTPARQADPLRYHPRVWLLGGLTILGVGLLITAAGAMVTGLLLLWRWALEPAQVLRIVWALMATVLAMTWLMPMITRTRRSRGAMLPVPEAAELHHVVREACRRTGIGAAIHLELCADAGLRLAPPESFGQALMGSPRTLQIGLGLLNEVSGPELASLSVATASEWGGRGYRLGGYITRVLQGIEGLGGAMGSGGCLQWCNPLFWLVIGLAQLLQHPALLRDFAWQRPLFTDALGSTGGSAVYYSGREAAVLNEAIWETTAYNVVFDLMEQGKQLKNLFRYYSEHKATIAPVNINMLRDAVFSAPGADGGDLPEGVMLPTLSQRLARVIRLPPGELDCKAAPARTLMPDIEQWEEKLTQALTSGLDQALQSAREELWEESQREIATMKDEYENRQGR